MKIRIVLLALTLSVFGFAGVIHGADVQKIVVVDVQKVMEESTAGRRSLGEIRSQGTKMEEILKEKQSEIEELKNALDQKALVMSDAAREEKEKDLREKIGDFKSLQRRYEDVLRDLNADLSQKMQKDVFEMAETMGKREGYTLIIDRRMGGVLYAPLALDITDKLIEEYNAMDAKRLKEEKASGESKKE